MSCGRICIRGKSRRAMAGSTPCRMASCVAGLESSGQKKWAHADKTGPGRVIFFAEAVVIGRVVQEEVFAYASSIELDSAAFDAFFPVAEPSAGRAPKAVDDAGRAGDRRSERTVAARRRLRKNGRPTEGGFTGARRRRARAVLDQQVPEKNYLTAFASRAARMACRITGGTRRTPLKTGEVMKAKTIEDHVRPLWKANKRANREKPFEGFSARFSPDFPVFRRFSPVFACCFPPKRSRIFRSAFGADQQFSTAPALTAGFVGCRESRPIARPARSIFRRERQTLRSSFLRRAPGDVPLGDIRAW